MELLRVALVLSTVCVFFFCGAHSMGVCSRFMFLACKPFVFSGIVPLLTALITHVGALLDHYEHCKQGRTHVLHECTFIASSAGTIRAQRLLFLRAPSHAASLSGEVHEVQSDLLQLDL